MRKDNVENFKSMRKTFPDEEVFQLLIRKGVYPYTYMDNESKFLETKLPPIDAFYNDLKNEKLSEEDYEHAQRVFNCKKLNIKSMDDYTKLYVLCDVLLLIDVFEAFRESSLNHFKLDCTHTYTSPGLSWEAMLLYSGVELELLTNIDAYNFFEMGLRGGVSMISKRYSKANNKYMGALFNPNLPEKYILYIDYNALYSFCMTQCLPIDNFTFLTPKDIEEVMEFIFDHPPDAPIGYVLEVDLLVPDEIHDRTSDYPLAPDHMSVPVEMLSPYTTQVLDNLDLLKHHEQSKIRKLIPSLLKKEKYIVHYRNLQFYVRQGLKVEKVYRIISFNQSPWMKGYVEFCMDMRKKSKNDVDKNLFKTMVI
jgi:hypothetical protein